MEWAAIPLAVVGGFLVLASTFWKSTFRDVPARVAIAGVFFLGTSSALLLERAAKQREKLTSRVSALEAQLAKQPAAQNTATEQK